MQILIFLIFNIQSLVHSSITTITTTTKPIQNIENNELKIQKKFSYYADIECWSLWEWFPFGHIECGGSIIAENWIITVADCFPKGGKYKCKILIDNNLPKNGKEIQIKEIFVHGSFSIALIETEIMKFSENVNAIQLPYDEYSKFDKEVVFLGGIKTESGFIYDSIGFEETNMIVTYNTEICKLSKILFYFCGLYENICKSVGKEGSPLILLTNSGPMLIGILIWEKEYQDPVAFIRVNLFLNWIKEKIKKE